MRRFALLVAVAGWGSAGCGADRELPGSEIQALFSGKTVAGYHELHEYAFRSFYDPSGVFRSYQDASRRPQAARWWVNGNQLCISWDAAPRDLCRKIVERGSGRYRKILRAPSGEAKVIVTFERFTHGNPAGL